MAEYRIYKRILEQSIIFIFFKFFQLFMISSELRGYFGYICEYFNLLLWLCI